MKQGYYKGTPARPFRVDVGVLGDGVGFRGIWLGSLGVGGATLFMSVLRTNMIGLFYMIPRGSIATQNKLYLLRYLLRTLQLTELKAYNPQVCPIYLALLLASSPVPSTALSPVQPQRSAKPEHASQPPPPPPPQ